MKTDYTQLTEQIRALYDRLHSNTLTADDIIDASEVDFLDNRKYVASIYQSSSEYDKSFKDFKQPYDIFRNFPEDKIVLDVGADWGYSALAMRHQGCRARIISVEAMQANAYALDMIKSLDNKHYDWFNLAAGLEEGNLTIYMPMLNGVPATGLSSTGSTLDGYLADHMAKLADTCPPKAEKNGYAVHETKLIVSTVRASRLDNILKENGSLQNDVVGIKMDIEGHESFALRGAEKLFTNQKPLLMLEAANRDDRVTSVMMSYGYFHCERHDGKLIPHLAYSIANDGFWVHPDKVEEYRAMGIFEGEIPTAEEIATPPQSDGFERKEPAGQS